MFGTTWHKIVPTKAHMVLSLSFLFSMEEEEILFSVYFEHSLLEFVCTTWSGWMDRAIEIDQYMAQSISSKLKSLKSSFCILTMFCLQERDAQQIPTQQERRQRGVQLAGEGRTLAGEAPATGRSPARGRQVPAAAATARRERPQHSPIRI